MPSFRSTVAFLALAVLALVVPRTVPAQQPEPPARALERLADEIAAEVESLRGWPFRTPVTKRRSTKEEALRYIERRTEAGVPQGRLALQEAMLRTIGLIPPGMGLKATLLGLLENQVGGYYDPETRALYLVERQGGLPAVAERLILAHELTHALDDQYVGLERLMKELANRSEDMDVVVSALGEGSATGLMVQYLARLQAAGRLDLAALQEYAAEETARSKPLLDAPPYFSALVASYVCGMQFLAKGNLITLALAPDNKAFGESFLAAVKNPPRSTEQILHPAKYWEGGTLDEPVVVDDRSVERWLSRPLLHLVHTDTLGEMLTAILTGPKDRRLDLSRMQQPGAWTSPAAAGWGGDRFFLLAEGATPDEARRLRGRLRGVWLTAWDTAGDRDEWLAALPDSSLPAGHAAVPVADRAGVVFIGFAEEERQALIAAMAQQPPAFARGGSPWSPVK